MTTHFAPEEPHFICGAANLEAARAEYELSAKRSAFFFAIQRQAEADLAALFHGPSLLKSGLFRTVSDHAVLCAWGWPLEADFMPDVGQR